MPPQGNGGRFRTVGRTQETEDLQQVELDARLGEPELAGDVPVRQAAGKAVEDVTLTVAHRVEAAFFLKRLLDFGRKNAFAVRRLADGVEDSLSRCLKC